MAIGYRAILSAESSQESLGRTVDVLRQWVSHKKGFTTLPVKGEVLTNADGSTLVADEVSETDRGVGGYRWTLSESWTPPSWYTNSQTDRTGVTQISLVFSQGQLWLWVDVEPPTLEYVDSAGRERVEIQPSGTPAFVSEILSQVEMHDGLERPAADIQVIESGTHVAHLMMVLRDEDRRGAVYVTAPPEGASSEGWRGKAERILGRIEGMGFGYMLVGTARNAFNGLVAEGHTVPAGSIRTFLPGADLDDPKDAVRHRLLHASTIRESSNWRLQRIIRNAQIDRLRDLSLPDPLRDADYAFLRQKALHPFDVLHAASPEEAEHVQDHGVDGLLARLKEAEELLQLAFDENEALREVARIARASADELRNENEETYLDAATLRSTVERDKREIDHLRRELSRLGGEGAAAAYGYVDQDATAEYPATFQELIVRLVTLEGIRYFGDPSAAEDLDEYSNLGLAAVMKAWDALVTFSAYAMAKSEGKYDQSLSHYISNTQHGLPMRISRVKWSEGETVRTNARMTAQRTVSGLPTSIDSSGSKLLVAHIALATGRAGSPRLYFDDTVSAAGFVTVGYIGPHLDNTLTN